MPSWRIVRCSRSIRPVKPRSERSTLLRCSISRMAGPWLAGGPTCPSACLHQQSKQTLGRTKISREQSPIRVGHHHQTHASEVMPFGDHLGAHQHIDLARMNLRQLLFQMPLEAGAVGIDAQHPIRAARGVRALGKPLLQVFLQLLGASALPPQIQVAAARAMSGHPAC